MGVQFGYTSPSFFLPPEQVVSWLKADAGITLSGSYVTKWDDQSGNDNYVYNVSTSYAPVYEPAYSGSYPSVVFDGIDDRLDFRTLLFSGQSDAVVFAVCKPNFTINTQAGLIGTSNYRYIQYQANGFRFQVGTGGVILELSKSIPTNTLHVATFIVVDRTSSFYLNNTNVTAQQGNNGTIGQLKWIGTGAVGTSPQFPFTGPISELIIVTGSLSPEVISNVNQSLIDKYISLL